MYKKAMVIDDVYLDRFVAEQVITKFKFAEEVILVKSAHEALAYLQSKENIPAELPEVIFVDIRMPELDGFAFVDQFEQMPIEVTKQCSIVMLTSSIDPKDMERVNKLKHVKGYLTKPLDKQKLEKLVSMHT